jgi:sugar diacid utilization regulator
MKHLAALDHYALGSRRRLFIFEKLRIRRLKLKIKGAIMPIHLKEEIILVIGASGSVKVIPSNNPMAREAYAELTKSYAKLQEIAQVERTGEQAAR